MPAMGLLAIGLALSTLPLQSVSSSFGDVVLNTECPQSFRSAATGRCNVRIAFVPQSIFAMPRLDDSTDVVTFADEANVFTEFSKTHAAGHVFSALEMSACLRGEPRCPVKGVDIDIMVKLFEKLDWDFTLVAYRSFPTALYATKSGAVAMGWFAAAITAKREACAGCPNPNDPLRATSENVCCLDFSSPYAEGGLAVASKGLTKQSWYQPLLTVRMLNVAMLFLLLLILSGHVMWLIESRTDTGSIYFPKHYVHGVFQGIYWSCTTATTVGYGDTGPTTSIGKLFTMFWMFVGIVLSGTMAGLMSSALTVNDLRKLDISGLSDLRGQTVCFVPGYYEDYMAKEGGSVRGRKSTSLNDCISELRAGTVDAVLYDKPWLDRYINMGWLSSEFSVSDAFLHMDYGVAFPQGSELESRVTAGLLALVQGGTFMKEILRKWLGVSDSGADTIPTEEEVQWNVVYTSCGLSGWLILAKLFQVVRKLYLAKRHIPESKEQEDWRTPAFNETERILKEFLGEMREHVKDQGEQVLRNQDQLLTRAKQSEEELRGLIMKIESAKLEGGVSNRCTMVL